MATQKLEELTIEQLKRKKKQANTLLIIMVVCFSISMIILLILKPSSAIVIIALWVTILPIAISRKKIMEELKRRGETIK